MELFINASPWALTCSTLMSRHCPPVGQNPPWVWADTCAAGPVVRSAQECRVRHLDPVKSSPDLRRMGRLASPLELLANRNPRSCAQSCPTLAAPRTVLWLLCPWDFPGENPGVCSHVLLQGVSPPCSRTLASCTGR